MHKLFHRFSRKNEKLLRRELALAHTCIIFLSLGIIGLLAASYNDVYALDHALIITVDVLLALVIVISISIVAYILKNRR